MKVIIYQSFNFTGVQDSDCVSRIEEMAASFTIKIELSAIIAEFLESTLLLKAVAIGEKMIREIEVLSCNC
jgi:hypothetical protein